MHCSNDSASYTGIRRVINIILLLSNTFTIPFIIDPSKMAPSITRTPHPLIHPSPLPVLIRLMYLPGYSILNTCRSTHRKPKAPRHYTGKQHLFQFSKIVISTIFIKEHNVWYIVIKLLRIAHSIDKKRPTLYIIWSNLHLNYLFSA